MHALKNLLMTAHRRLGIASGIVLLMTLLLLLFQASTARAQITDKDLSDPSLTDNERKQATLQWLDKYFADSVLMSKEDIAKIRGAVAQMSPSQLQGWLEQTKKLNEYVESPEWQATKRWLRGFLRVQAIYSDKELEKLRKEIYNADADQMLDILQRIQEKHDSLTWMYQASQQTRAQEVEQRNTRVAQQAAAASSSRSSRSSSSALFGSGFSTGQKKSGYRPPGPLITSNEVARAAVSRQVWGGVGWGRGF